jgi:uncharacterized protein YjbI with pentapeptide repeats
VTRVRTLTLLERLDGRRKRTVMRFLSESGLLDTTSALRIELTDADFTEAHLSHMTLPNNQLEGIRFTGADLRNADLRSANLGGANLSGAVLSGVMLGAARPGLLSNRLALWVWGREVAADAQSNRADLSNADLSYADLEGAKGWTVEQLTSAMSLKGATMPDGQVLTSHDNPDEPTFEEWLESKGSGEDGSG